MTAGSATERVVAVIQARTGSSRLPGKVLADLDGRPVVSHLVATAKAAATIDQVVLAVPSADRPLQALGVADGVTVVTGDEEDVLARFGRAAAYSGADVIVRLTGDCPLLDRVELDRAVTRFLTERPDYLSVEEYPRGTADIEVVSRTALDAADRRATDGWHREHVCTYFPDHRDDFRVRYVTPPPELHRPELRVCVDQAEDLEAVRAVVHHLGGRTPRVADVIGVLDAHPEVAAINAEVRQVTRG